VTDAAQPAPQPRPSSRRITDEEAVAVQARFRRRAVLVGAGVVLAVLVGAIGLVQGGGNQEGGGDAVVSAAPAFPRPSMGRGSGAVEKDAVAPEPGGRDQAPPGVPVGSVQRQLVRTAQLTVEVGDPAGAVRQVRAAAAGAGGFITEEQTSDTGSWLVLRVPADALDRVVDEIAGFGRVTSRTSQVQDATEEVVDLDARVASQAASVARVRGLLAEARSIGDVVAIESELARREAELDSLTRRLEALRDQVAMSTLTVDLRSPFPAPAPDVRETPGFLDGLAAGWAGLRTVGTAAAAVVGFVLPFLPVLALLGGLGLLGRRVVRSRRATAPAVASGGQGPDATS
jgi:hypothetical protein